MERPDGIIITISRKYLNERGRLAWMRDFMKAMDNDGCSYWMRLGNRPKHEVLYIYLILGNKIRYRMNFVMYEKGGVFHTADGRDITAKNWLVGTGPLVLGNVKMKGFQGFRYTQIIF